MKLSEEKEYIISGVVLDVIKDEYIILEVRSAFHPLDELELIPFKGNSELIKLDFITDINDEEIQRTRPGMLVKIPYNKNAQRWNMVRMRVLQ